MRRASTGRWTALIAALVCQTGAHAVRGDAPAAGRVNSPVVFVQIPAGAGFDDQPARRGGMLRADYGKGGRIVRLDPGGRLRVLTEGFDSACDPSVSFDGKRVLFAAKRESGDPWNIWEMNGDGTGARPITRDLGNCRSPAYQATLYTIISTEPWYQIMFVSDVADEMDEYGSGPSMSLYSCKLDGSAMRRLTMNLSDDMDPFLMDDGRTLLASWQRMDLRRGFGGRVALFGVNTDGTDYVLYCGDEGRRIKHMPCATTGGLVVFIEADRVGWDGAGQPACVRVRRPLHSYRPITRDADWLYHSPSPLPDGAVLVSRRPADGSATHAVCRLDPETGETQLIFDDPDYHDFHARALVSRPVPDGRSSVVNEDYPTGRFYCLNAYVTDASVQALMRPGMIRRARVIEGVPLSADERSTYLPKDVRIGISGPGSTENGIPPVVQKRLLGEVPLASDGSFNIEVPADVPVQLQTLDENGMALRTCGWIWVKHREPRGCIGCHEDGELAPENRFVQAVQRPSINLTLPPSKRRTVDFRRDVMPIIANKCATAACHGNDGAMPNLSGARTRYYSRAYESLLAAAPEAPADDEPVVGKYVHPGQARTSPLIWRLYGRNTSRPWDETHGLGQVFPPHPPAGADSLTEDEKKTFVEWIDLGALWDGIPGSDDPPVKDGAGVRAEGAR